MTNAIVSERAVSAFDLANFGIIRRWSVKDGQSHAIVTQRTIKRDPPFAGSTLEYVCSCDAWACLHVEAVKLYAPDPTPQPRPAA